MTKAWGVRGPVKFDTYKHLREGASRIAVCMLAPQGAGSLNVLKRRYVVIRYLKWRSARHPGPFSLSFWLTSSSLSSLMGGDPALFPFSPLLLKVRLTFFPDEILP